MTTSLQIGRLGLDIDLDAPMAWQESGDRVSLSGIVYLPSSTAEAKHLAEQIVNLAGRFRSERQVPLITTAWPERDGWVEVESSEVTPAKGFAPGVNVIQWSASMRRVPGRAMPRYELRRLGYPIANDHSIIRSSYAGWVSYPASASAPDFGDDTTWTLSSRTTDTGSVAYVVGGSTTLYDTVCSLYVPIEDAYDGALKIEVDISGSGSWRAVVGKDMDLPAANRVRINNGLIRATWDSTNHRLEVEVYTGTVWEAVEDEFGFTTGGASLTAFGTDPVSATVVRNDASRVTLQFLLPILTGQHRAIMFLSLRRGDRNILGSIKSSSSRQFGIVTSTLAAATTLTSGIRRTSNDANGNRYILCSPRTFTADLSFGNLYLTTGSKSFPFGIGVELGGSGASGYDAASNLASQYYAQPGEQIYISLP